MKSLVKFVIVCQLIFIACGKEMKRPVTQMFKHRANGIFDKIINKEIPCDLLYEDNDCLAFDELQPQAPIHFIVLPKKKIISLALASESDAHILGHMMIVAKKIAAQKLLKGYRVVMNSGREAYQTTGQLHLHVLGGRVMHWPPG